MAANLRFETSSSSPDGAQFMAGLPNGHRNMDRSSSFRDTHDGRTFAGSGTAPGPASDVVPLSQLLSLDPIPLGEEKYARQIELRRVTNAVTRLAEDPSSFRSLDSLGTEELKRVKNSISENSSKARERSRYLAEAIVKLDKYRSSLQSKKRSRPDTPSANDRGPGASPPERPLTVKPAGQPDAMKPADKSMSLVPSKNKRLRTSIADGRGEGGARPNNLSMKKSADRESPRSLSVLPSPTEEKVRANEGWDKNKLKGRRSAIKTDPNIASAGNGVLEGERDHKWSGQHRLSQEARPRATETHGLRSGPVHGVTSIHKAEASLQMNGSAARGVCKGETEVVGGEKTDRFTGTDRERLPKNGLKPPLQEDMHIVPGASAVTKVKAARAPRSSSVASTHLSHLTRVSALSDKPQASTKPQLPSGQGNRKRPAPSRSSSPVTQWGGQRPQKMARVARRVNIPPGGILPPAEDASSVPDALPDREPSATVGMRSALSNTTVAGFPRRVPAGSVHSPAQSKPRSERIMSSVVSESEESEEASENKVKEKSKKQADWEPRPISNHKTNVVLPAKASQPLLKEDVGDGVRRQNRSGRNFCMPKPVVTTIEKVDVATSTAKQLRSARTEKPDRPGRTPTKKATADRKSLARIRRPPVGASAAELGSVLLSPGESDDDHEELVSAVRAAVDASAAACLSDFWKEMEPYFAFLTADDLCYLRQLADSKWSGDVSSTPVHDGLQNSCHLANGNSEPDSVSERLEVRSGGRVSGGGGGGWYDKIYPLSQRLLAALINEGDDESTKGGEGDSKGDSTRDGFGPAVGTTADEYRDMRDGSLCSNGHWNYDEAGSEADDILADKPGTTRTYETVQTKTEGYCNSRSTGTWESQYEQMGLDERILLELQSIGLAVEQVPDLSQRDEDEICMEICKLKDELKDQVCVNKQRVETLEKSVLANREDEMRDRERHAISKLVEIAYSRRKGCRGSSGGAGTKGAGNKGTRAAALAFSKRALARVRKFEAGHSCFVDSSLRDILFCAIPKSSDAIAGANSVDTSGTPAVSETSVPKPGGKLILRRADAKDKDSSTDHTKGRDAAWTSWKDREVSPEDLTGATSVRNTVGFGGAKGKRSERERDGKGQGKESHRKSEHDRVPRQSLGTIKGERKTKTKPRQKTVFKDVNGLGKPAEAPKEKLPPPLQQEGHSIPALGNPVIPEAGLDLGQLAIPEDFAVHDEAWLAMEDAAFQDQGEILMGLDVPMDDLSDLGSLMM